jgi:hypothetical protein
MCADWDLAALPSLAPFRHAHFANECLLLSDMQTAAAWQSSDAEVDPGHPDRRASRKTHRCSVSDAVSIRVEQRLRYHTYPDISVSTRDHKRPVTS